MVFWTLGGLSALLVAFRILTKKPVFLPPKPVLFALLLFWVTYALSTVVSIHPSTSLIGVWEEFDQNLLHYTVLILIFLATFHLKTLRPKLVLWFSWAITFSAAVSSLWGIVEYLFIFPSERITSTIGEPNRLGLFLIAVIPISFSLLVSQSTRKTKFALAGVNGLILLAILLTYSRGSWLILIVAGLAYCIFSFHTLGKKLPQLTPVLITIFITLILGVGIFWPRSTDKYRLGRTLYNLVHQQGSSHIRLLEWQATVQTILKRSTVSQHLIGTGPATVTYTFLRQRPPAFNRLPKEQYWRLTQVRNHYLNILTNTGLLGLGVFLLFISQVLTHLPRPSAQTKQNLPLLFSWGIILLSGWYSFFPLVTQTMFWVLGALLLSSQQKITLLARSALARYGLSLSGICLFFALTIFTTFVSIGEALARQRHFSAAIWFFPWADFYYREAAQLTLENPASEQTLYLAFNQALQAYRFNPLEPKNLFVLEKILAEMSLKKIPPAYPSLTQIRQEWVSKDPTSPRAHDHLGLTYLAEKNWSAAIAEFSLAATLDPSYQPAQRHLFEALIMQKQE